MENGNLCRICSTLRKLPTWLRRISQGLLLADTFAWLNAFKRVITRWDRCLERYTAFVHLGLSMILLRRYL